jgi:hypothetical protein
MASKKQRRRRAKERRHEYEYVYVDEEGHEVEVPPEEVEQRGGGKENGKPKEAKSRPRTAGQKTAGKGARPARVVTPPSWPRVLKRGAIFAPFMFLTISLLARHLSVASRLIQTAYLLILFIPFSYLVDRAMYRRYLRQTGKLPDSKKAK